MKRSRIRDGLKWDIERLLIKGHRLNEAVTLGELITILSGADFLDYGDESRFEKLDELLDHKKIEERRKENEESKKED